MRQSEAHRVVRMHDVRPFLKPPFGEPGSLLYVGYRPDAHSWLWELLEVGNEVTVLEIWPSNVTSALETETRVSRWIVGDVRQAEMVDGIFDHVWWWHGPEHVERAEFPGTLEKLKAKARRCVAVASPWGLYGQGPHGGNPNEIHRWSVYPEDFEQEGLGVRTDGEADQPGSEIVGWIET